MCNCTGKTASQKHAIHLWMFDWLVGKAHPPTHDAPPHDDAMAAVVAEELTDPKAPPSQRVDLSVHRERLRA